MNRKRINLSNTILIRKSFKFLRNRENKVGKLANEYIAEKIKNLNEVSSIDGIIEFYKFYPINLNDQIKQQDLDELYKVFEIRNNDDIIAFLNFFKSVNFERSALFFINMDFPVKMIPLEFFNLLNIDNLIIEDILSEDKYIKADFFRDYMFFSFIMPVDFKNLSIENLSFEQLNIIFKDNILILIQEGIKGDIFDIIRIKLNKKDSILKQSLDYLLYYIIDVIVDKFLVILEKIEEEVYKIEENFFNNQFLYLSNDLVIGKIYNLKRNMILIRNFSLKMLEIIKLLKANYSDERILNYYKDLIDHNYRLIDVTDNLEHIFNNVLNLYISHLNYRQNDIMRILTIVNTIFVPIIFIASIYGMNFEYIPELKWKYGYYFTLFIMLITTIISVIYFKKKKIL
jgi:magnesium transporter